MLVLMLARQKVEKTPVYELGYNLIGAKMISIQTIILLKTRLLMEMTN